MLALTLDVSVNVPSALKTWSVVLMLSIPFWDSFTGDPFQLPVIDCAWPAVHIAATSMLRSILFITNANIKNKTSGLLKVSFYKCIFVPEQKLWTT